MGLFKTPPRLGCPGLFITGTDTDVGKTVAACAIAATLRGRGMRVGVCKPIATGCRFDVSRLVSDDAEALAHYADCRLPLDVVNPVRYREALAPLVAADRAGRPVGFDLIAESLERLDAASDVMLIEGIGGLLVPLADDVAVLDLAAAIGYPVAVVTRPDLGTLNHTAMTCALIRQRGLRLAGLILNRYNAETSDTAHATNPPYLARLNQTTILATLPDVKGEAVTPHRARIPGDLLAAAETMDWAAAARRAAPC